MSGKYFAGSGYAFGVLQPRGCGGLSAGFINDVIAGMCWAVSGEKVLIEDLVHSIHAGFEVCNFNFRADVTAAPIPNKAKLPGPYSTVA